MGHEPIDRVDEYFEGHDGLGKAIVIAIVVTLLIAAITGLAQIRALTRHDAAVSRADQWVAVASEASTRSDAMAQLQLDRFYLAQAARVRFEQARADAILGVGPPAHDSWDDAKRWQYVYDSIEAASAALTRATRGTSRGVGGEFTDIQALTQGAVPEIPQEQLVGERASCPGATATWPVQPVPGPVPQTGPDSLQGDPNFPSRYLADNRRTVFFLQARGTLASEHAQDEEKQFTRFGVSLTLFATAVFLFGFALSPYGRLHRRLYATGAVLCVIGSSVWALYAAIATPPNENALAAAAYADAQVASARGADPHDLRTAIAFDSCTTGIDARFAPAYTNKALALNSLFAANDPTGGTNIQLVSTNDRQSALVALKLAQDNGAADPMLPMVQGADLFQAGLDASHGVNASKLGQALQLDRAAGVLLAGSPTEGNLVAGSGDPAGGELAARKAKAAKLLAAATTIAFNIAEAELALERFGQARSAYTTAVNLASQQVTPMNEDPQYYAAGALTDLGHIAQRARVTGDQALYVNALEEKNYVVAHLFPGDTGPRRSAKITDTVVLPGLAAFKINRGATFDQSNAINAQWYYRPSAAISWSAFSPGLSGYPGMPNASAGDYFTAPFVPTTACLGSGQYMVELYVNGRLVNQSRPITVKLGNVVPATFQDMDVSVCVPASPGRQWQPLPAGSPHPGAPTRVAGLIDGYLSPDHRAGLLVFDVSPEAARELGGSTSARLDEALHQLRPWLPGRPLFGSGFGFPFLGGSNGVQTRAYAYHGGLMAVGIGATGSGREIVAVVYGPYSWFIRGHIPAGAVLLGSVVSRE